MIPTVYLNKVIFVKVDRPMGSRHPKHGFLYPVNYGFVPDTVSGDGEELDAYILGIGAPLTEFTGRCIAIIHRTNDDDDKLIIVPDGVEMSDAEIEKETEFQEKWFRHAIVRNPFVTRTHRGIYGVVRKDNKILLIRKARGPYTGLYDLPGGGPEEGKTPNETLTREIREETGCRVSASEFISEKTIFFSDFTPASGETGCMQHTGVLFSAEIEGEPTPLGDGLDSGGAEWVDIDTLTSQNATPFALIGAEKDVITLANDEDFPVDVGVRRQPRPDNRHPMIAAVLVFNGEGKIILSRVAKTKKVDAGKWSYTAGGHVDAGESYEVAAVRELAEETGLSGVQITFIGKTYTQREGHIGAFHHVFRAVTDKPIAPDPKEIDEVKAFDPVDLACEIKTHPEEFKDTLVNILTAYLKIA